MDARTAVVVLVGLLAVALRSRESAAQVRCDSSPAAEVLPYTRVSDGEAYALWPSLRPEEFYTLRTSTSYYHRAGGEGIWSPFVGSRGGRYHLRSDGAFRKGSWAAFGGARYQWTQRDSVGGNLLAAPELFYPYLMADNSRRTERIESYGMHGGASFRYRRLLLGVGAQFDGTTHFSRRDPRVRGRAGDFSVNATAGVEFLGYVASATGAFRRYFEPLSISIEREQSMERIYFLLGFGLFDHSLSKLVKSLEVHYLYRAWQARVDFHPVRADLPSLYVAYAHGKGQLITSELAEASRADTDRLRGALQWQANWTRWALSTTLGVEYDRRVGTEIFYRWHEVNVSPKIYERREYNRVKKYTDFRVDVRGDGRVAYKVSPAAFYADAACGYTSYGSRYEEGTHRNDFDALGYRIGLGARYEAQRFAVDISLYGHQRLRLGGASSFGTAPHRQEEFYAEWYDVISSQKWGLGGAADFSMLLSGGHRLGVQVGGGWMRRLETDGQGYMVGGGLWYSFGRGGVEVNILNF